MMRSEQEIINKIVGLFDIANNPKKYGFIKSGQAKKQIEILEWVLYIK